MHLILNEPISPGISRLMDLGFGEAVVGALQQHATQPGVQQQGLVVAANLSSGSEQRKNRLMALGIGKVGACLGNIFASFFFSTSLSLSLSPSSLPPSPSLAFVPSHR